MKRNLTPAFVRGASMPAPATTDRVIYWDEKLPSFGLMVTAAGHKSFVVQYRANGVSKRMTIKGAATGVVSPDQARREARRILNDVYLGGDPAAERQKAERAAKDTVQAVCEAWFAKEGKKLRSGDRRRAELERLVYPVLGARPITDIRRSDIKRLLDQIEDESRGSGAATAHLAFAYLRKIFNWFATNSDDFQSPLVRGMSSFKQKPRERVLTDDELRAIWKAADDVQGPFGCYIQFLLLTAVRRNEASDLRYREVSGTDWTIPAARYKTACEHVVPLSGKAREILERLPRIGSEGFVFTTSGTSPIAPSGPAKHRFDKACGVKGWTLHDLRRTARSLMSRAGVNSDIAERCLGHVIGGVRGVYDRHQYLDEKRRAFEALAAQIERIVDPRPNVVALHR
jgi:integrase